ncbi:hypothetical protein [Pedobacter punctiformis]|uniref:Uncharacterized protein n=1 Tax=Pedobacter punctiformis TaxID=3004097 RepID=A0ABT4L8W0_9SPHI|nr:hypothetical protein [Pedobacter sp. HCMS5-2]MCZ4244365.1 hypothetical protein [Pedobacter sp. HCMS5-2]
MKKTVFYLAFLAIPLMFSCNQSGKKAGTTDSTSTSTDTISNAQCYKAGYEKDSADLKIETLSSGKVKGKLAVKYAVKPMNDGLIAGEFKGDTLFVNYTFKTGEDTVSVHTNPLAFLKKDGKLIMGVGQIETTLGRSYFVKGKPINFERGKFTFEPADCK